MNKKILKLKFTEKTTSADACILPNHSCVKVWKKKHSWIFHFQSSKYINISTALFRIRQQVC